MNGKGDKDRTNKHRQYWDNYDKAFKKSKTRKKVKRKKK
jgi:hypothetical protein